ncbi:MAG TPA: hypothetical protein VLR46_08620 [Candidatus Dormibacteraeota bacterium]|nr:hypothetical protein [Candidatus Dormibacteraeota bacterium]
MKRILLGFAVCAGMLVMGVTNASAARYCSIDPTLGIGAPIQTNLNLRVSLLGTSAHIYASTTNRTTTFGGVLGLP